MTALAVSGLGEATIVADDPKDAAGSASAKADGGAQPVRPAARMHGTAYGYTNICLVYDEASLRPSQIAAALKVVERTRGDFVALGMRLAGFSARHRNRGAVLAGCLSRLPGATADNTRVEIYYAVDGVLHSDISRGQFQLVSVRPDWRDLSSISLDDFTRFVVNGQLAIARDPARYMATK